MLNKRRTLLNVYNKLYKHFGPQHWWPAKRAFEVMVGAILTQNTAWANVEKAITNLKKEKLLSPKGIENADLKRLKLAIRPSGFYNEKAKKLKDFVGFYIKKRKKLNGSDAGEIREMLLGVKGIGPETADSIILYALKKPVFVIDAYTRRVLARHALASREATYDEMQNLFMQNLPKKIKMFNEYHALFVRVAKNYCRKKKPLCGKCPLNIFKYSKNMV